MKFHSSGEKVDTAKKEEGKETSAKKEEATENSVMTELYLIDKNGYVVSQSIPLPGKESVAKQALEHLVVNGPVQEVLPNGFRAVIPADTQVSVVTRSMRKGKARRRSTGI